jgi:hypothetical protein
MTETSQTASPQLSQQALIVYKGISDQFDFLKKQQWATTNYVVLIYAALAWFGQHVELPPLALCILSAGAIAVGLLATGILIWFQYDLGQIRKRSAIANDALFSVHERQALGLVSPVHPYLRGWHVIAALILVCLTGAGLVVLALNLPTQR